MTALSQPGSHEDRSIGCLLGTACGDILGAAVEGWPAHSIQVQYGQVRNFLKTERGYGCYTDDTQMTLVLAASLVEQGYVHAQQVARRYAECFEPRRGYGASTKHALRSLLSAADYRVTGRLMFAEGSHGSGGAMRIAPVGLAYRNASDELLLQAVEAALLCTHVHPEAIAGAYLQAKAVALLAAADPGKLDRPWLVEMLIAHSTNSDLKRKLEAILQQLDKGACDEEVIRLVGNGVRTSEALSAALWAFLRYGDTPEECLIHAVNFGGDTDTIGALVGAQLGSLYGTAWIPNRWYSFIENQEQGRDAMVELARQLARLDVRR